jgi:hypothetical protein
MTASLASPDPAPATRRRNRSVWRQFFDAVTESRAWEPGDEVAAYLQRHRHDLPPQVWIELERRRLGP